MNYDEIVGQKEAKSHLIKMVNENRVPHALLFSGKEGCGNLPAAFVFAQHLFCQKPGPSGPCGECPACARTSKLSHPDLHMVFPIAKNKDVKSSADLAHEFRESFLANPYLTLNGWFDEISAENKLPIIPVEDSAEIIRRLSYTSYEGSYKLVIIWCPEKMHADGANKILKVLEEPPEKTVFVLVSSYADQLLATIRSRTQLIQFYDCSEEEISQALIPRLQVSEELARQAALLAQGSYAEALKLVSENAESVTFLGDFQEFMRIALRFDGGKATQWVEENALRGREKHKQFLQFGLEIFRDCLMHNYGEPSLVRLNGTEKSFLEKFSPYVHQGNYAELVKNFNDNYYYVERYANPKILFMDLLFRTNELLNRKQ